MTHITITVLAPEEWATWRDLRLAALADAPTAFRSTLAREQEYDERAWRDWVTGSPCFVAASSGGHVGITSVRPEDDHLLLIAMWVAPGARGSGAADALVRAVLDHARELGRLPVQLCVTRGNERARRLYERHGFVQVGIDADGEACMRATP